MVSANDFPLLGSTGSESTYVIPRVESLDAVVEVVGIAEMRDMVPVRRLRSEVSFNDLPLRAYILGRVDRYGGSPCKSGVLQGQDVIMLGPTPSNKTSRFGYVRNVPVHAFNNIYEVVEKYEPAKQGPFRDFFPKREVVILAPLPLKGRALDKV